MKKISLLLSLVFLFSFAGPTYSLTEKERKDAIDLLQSTEQSVFDAVKGLSEAQLKYKPAADRWSVEDCVKHIAITEMGLWKMTEGTIAQAPNPDKRADIKASDEQVVAMTEDRSKKVKTSEELEPQNTPFKSLTEAVESFRTNREKLVEYVKTTDADLRNHVAALPFGSFDAYQLILLIAAHSNRHMQQINEVKGDAGFPKN